MPAAYRALVDRKRRQFYANFGRSSALGWVVTLAALWFVRGIDDWWAVNSAMFMAALVVMTLGLAVSFRA